MPPAAAAKSSPPPPSSSSSSPSTLSHRLTLKTSSCDTVTVQHVSQNVSSTGAPVHTSAPVHSGAPMRHALSPSVALCLRAVYAAFLWHEGIVHDAMASASYLKFHPTIPKHLPMTSNLPGRCREDQHHSLTPAPASRVYVLLSCIAAAFNAAAEAPKRGGYWQPNNNICLHD